MNTFLDQNKKDLRYYAGRSYSMLIGPVLLIFVICSCSVDNLRPTPFVPTASPFKISPTNSPIPTETHTITLTPTPTPTLTPSPTSTPTFSNPFSSLKSGQYFLYNIKKGVFGVSSADGQKNLEFSLPPAWSIYGVAGLSPDHKKLELVRQVASFDLEKGALLIADLDGGKDQLLMGEGTSCRGAAWSPNGAQLVAACNTSLYLFSLTTGEKDKLPAEKCRWNLCENVNWSPDGKWITYQTGDIMHPDEAGVFLMSTACFAQPSSCSTSRHERVSPYQPPAPYAWSPDSKYLVFASMQRRPVGKENDLVLNLFNIQSRQIQRTIEISGPKWDEALALVWSPDGKWIAFNQFDGIYKVPVEGGAPVLVTHLSWPFIFQWITIPHPFAPGAKYTLTPAGNGLNLRDQPSQAGKPLKVLKAGDEITIVKGPTLADGYTWWQMRTQDGVVGWAEDLPDWYQ